MVTRRGDMCFVYVINGRQTSPLARIQSRTIPAETQNWIKDPPQGDIFIMYGCPNKIKTDKLLSDLETLKPSLKARLCNRVSRTT